MLNNPNHRVAAYCIGGVAAMAALTAAAVPLYRLYCQVTGTGGTTQRAERASDIVLDKIMTVRFDSNVSKELPWRFEPVVRTLDVKLGETTLAFYRATNTSDKTVKGTAIFNVSPDVAGIYFNKIECFCFKEQTLAAGESIEMPVSFFVDPKIAGDRDAAHIKEITLSYTFYPVTGAAVGAAPAPEGTGKGS
jgi:cytochrome c oxidase assembly protein subunit 11